MRLRHDLMGYATHAAEPLSPSERRTFLAHSIKQVVSALLNRQCTNGVRARPLYADAARVRLVGAGASPLRVYTAAATTELTSDLIKSSTTICYIGCGGGGHPQLAASLCRRPVSAGRGRYYTLSGDGYVIGAAR